MTKQTRVNPAGELVAVNARGTLMGNRGCLHDENGRVVRRSARKAWVTCRLDYQGIKRTLLSPGKYTELFFLDEATALAAGHRPCSTCRPLEVRLFSQAWGAARGQGAARTPEIDDRLTVERSNDARVVHPALPDLPSGAIVRQESTMNFYLVQETSVLPWSFNGYGPAVDASAISGPVIVMTPLGTIMALSAGYEAKPHPSAI